MQENNFETIISTWRRMSGEIIEPATVSMSGDSPDYQQRYKKKEEEANLPEISKPSMPIAIAGTAATASETSDNTEAANPEEKQGLIRYAKEESKEAAGDANEKDVKFDKDYLENTTPKNPEKKQEDEKHGDKLDSVFLRPPPLPHKVNSTPSTVEEEDCGIKCLYYTLQCCDCVLM